MPQQKHKRVRHYHEPGDVHELTFSCYKSLPLLVSDQLRVQLSQCISAACENQNFRLAAFVFMPNHIHLLVYPIGREGLIGPFLAAIKRPFSAFAKQELIAQSETSLLEQLLVHERPGKLTFRFWQEGGGYDRNLQNQESVTKSIDYIHMNPVRKSLCAKAIDWPWSSARFYLSDPPQQEERCPHITPLPAHFF
jgi:putative transposase